jgi:hypothetical protein
MKLADADSRQLPEEAPNQIAQLTSMRSGGYGEQARDSQYADKGHFHGKLLARKKRVPKGYLR